MKTIHLCILAFIITFGLGILIIYIIRPVINTGNTYFQSNTESVEAIFDESKAIYPFEIPSSWHIDASFNRETGGWRQTGVAHSPLEDVILEVDKLMISHGFKEIKSVNSQELGKPGKLTEYESSGRIQVMWMLWAIGLNKTGFSWGRVQ